MKLFYQLFDFFVKIYLKVCISRVNFFYKKKSNPNYNYQNLINLLENKKIALVGNSKNLLNLNDNIIDDYDIVVRINHLPDIKFYNKIGKRCDILMLTHGPMHLIDSNFIKVWLDNKNVYYSNYLFHKIYHYKESWLFELKNLLNANPSTGARSLHFLINILKNPNITLFGFTHESKAWYHKLEKNWTSDKINKVENSSSILNNPIGHDFDSEKKYFYSLLSDNIKYFEF